MGEDFFLHAFDEKIIQENINKALPSGMDVLAIGIFPTSGDSLQEAVDACVWEVRVSGTSLKNLK